MIVSTEIVTFPVPHSHHLAEGTCCAIATAKGTRLAPSATIQGALGQSSLAQVMGKTEPLPGRIRCECLPDRRIRRHEAVFTLSTLDSNCLPTLLLLQT